MKNQDSTVPGVPDSAFNGLLCHGRCEVTKRWSTMISVILNVIATLTIGSSYYIMQCLSAPTGSEMRKAHKNGRSLQIGVITLQCGVYVPYQDSALVDDGPHFDTCTPAFQFRHFLITADEQVWFGCSDRRFCRFDTLEQLHYSRRAAGHRTYVG